MSSQSPTWYTVSAAKPNIIGQQLMIRTSVDPARHAHVPVIDADTEARRDFDAQDVIVGDAVPVAEIPRGQSPLELHICRGHPHHLPVAGT